jgi:putative ABC transport system permease protein
MYVPLAQVPFPTATIVVRTETANPATMVNTLRGAVARVDVGLPLTAVRVFDEYRVGSLAGARFNALLVSIFAAVALVLTAVGIYGVIAYSVSARTREIGVRMALGALPSAIFRLVVGPTMALVGVSVGVGLFGALVCARLMRSVLYAVDPWDPATFASTAIILTAVAWFACWLPARRAASMNPIEALRDSPGLDSP